MSAQSGLPFKKRRLAEGVSQPREWWCPYSIRQIQLAGREIVTLLLCLWRHRATGKIISAGFLAGENAIQRRIKVFCKGHAAHLEHLFTLAKVHYFFFNSYIFY